MQCPPWLRNPFCEVGAFCSVCALCAITDEKGIPVLAGAPLSMPTRAGQTVIILPDGDCARGKRCGNVDEPLVGRAAEAQRDVVQLLHKGAVYQDVQAGENAVHVRGGVVAVAGELLPGAPGVHPDVLLGIGCPHALEEGRQGRGVLWLRGLAAQDGEPVDVGCGKRREDAPPRSLV